MGPSKPREHQDGALARKQAFISALTTEQFVLQAAHSANISEISVRHRVHGAVSSALIALRFLARLSTRGSPHAGIGRRGPGRAQQHQPNVTAGTGYSLYGQRWE
jgi:hypothetical protein